MHRNCVILIVLLAVLMVSVSGCVLAAVGAGAAGTVAYMRGDLEAIRVERVNEVYEATKKAVTDLGYAVTKDQKDATSAEINLRDAQDKKIIIKLNATPEGPTDISIRVGTFGDESLSRLIYDKIKENLDKASK